MHYRLIQTNATSATKEIVHGQQSKTSSPPICGALILTAFALPFSLCPTPWNIRTQLNFSPRSLMNQKANSYVLNSQQARFESPWSPGTLLLRWHPSWKRHHNRPLSSRGCRNYTEKTDGDVCIYTACGENTDKVVTCLRKCRLRRYLHIRI